MSLILKRLRTWLFPHTRTVERKSRERLAAEGRVQYIGGPCDGLHTWRGFPGFTRVVERGAVYEWDGRRWIFGGWDENE